MTRPKTTTARTMTTKMHSMMTTPKRLAAVRPFASLPPLPADVNDAFEAYKLCILRHKLAGAKTSPATTC